MLMVNKNFALGKLVDYCLDLIRVCGSMGAKVFYDYCFGSCMVCWKEHKIHHVGRNAVIILLKVRGSDIMIGIIRLCSE